MASDRPLQAPTDPRIAEIWKTAHDIAWDDYGNESNAYASWESNHSCGSGGYGCCGGGKDIDRPALEKAIAAALSVLQQRVEQLTAIQDAARVAWAEERSVLQAALDHAEQRVEQLERADGQLNSAGRQQFDRAVAAEHRLEVAKREIAQLTYNLGESEKVSERIRLTGEVLELQAAKEAAKRERDEARGELGWLRESLRSMAEKGRV